MALPVAIENLPPASSKRLTATRVFGVGILLAGRKVPSISVISRTFDISSNIKSLPRVNSLL